MLVIKKNGVVEAFKVEKILSSTIQACRGIEGTEPLEIVSRSLEQVQSPLETDIMWENLVAAAHTLSHSKPGYRAVASRLLSDRIAREIKSLRCFGDLLFWLKSNDWSDSSLKLAFNHLERIEWAINHERDEEVPHDSLQRWRERRLLRNSNGQLMERPQWMLMRLSLEKSSTITEVLDRYTAPISQWLFWV